MKKTDLETDAFREEVYRKLEDLRVRVFNEFAIVSKESFIVKPSMPILYFGDLEGYLNSKIRIITVGINPSKIEFPTENSFQRFALYNDTVESYWQSLNNYFKCKPYMGWFDNYENVLNGAGASFGNINENIALHTDLFSTVATDPTWSKLSCEQQRMLQNSGNIVWHDLVKIIQPHAVIVSIKKDYLKNIGFLRLNQESELISISRERDYKVTKTTVEYAENGSFEMIFGKAAEKPFATVADKDKANIGLSLHRILSGYK